ncbi:MAG: 50S ribosomal protein L6 [Myxococcota bacterium]|nr:50S ribosomal protein L6 [Myxococcota bacterium]
MSRIGKKPIPLPDKVSFELTEGQVIVSGPRGRLTRPLPPLVAVVQEERELKVSPVDETREARGMWGLARTLINNMVVGVTAGYTRELLIEGVGYRVAPKDARWLHFTLGYSHPILYELPEGVSAEVDLKVNKITLKSSDKEMLGLAAATIRSFRKPEPYKGKGIRYANEKIRRKAGKAGSK